MSDNAEAARLVALETTEDFLFTGDRHNDGVYKANRSFRLGALVGFMVWVVALCAIERFAPFSLYEEPQGLEREMHLLSILFMVMTNGSRLLNMVFREKSRFVGRSGVILACLVVQGVSIWANAYMAFFPNPVMVDHISGQKFYLIRWAEWLSLTFLLSFLSHNIDRVEGPSFLLPTVLMISTGSGFVFPLCETREAWLATLFVALILFLPLYVALLNKAIRFSQVKASMKMSKRPSALQQERYQICRYSYMLAMTCAVTWTTLVVSFVLVCLAPENIPMAGHISRSTLLVIHNCINEVSSKYYYFSVLTDAYEMVFETSTRLARRLDESRGFMSAVWESSSDVIVFSTRKQERVSAYVSLAFLNLVNFSKEWREQASGDWDSLFLDIYPEKAKFSVYLLNTSATNQDAVPLFDVSRGGKLMLDSEEGKDVPTRNLTSLARLIIRAFDGDGEGKQVSFMDKDRNPKSCEATISRLKEDKMVITLRDISDRIERFETEKNLVKERANRAKDAEINHFTRHEVKNGILQAIGIVDQLRERVDKRGFQLLDFGARFSERNSSAASKDKTKASKRSPGRGAGSELDPSQHKPLDASTGLNVLDSALGEVLDTILDEAMAREIIHGDYVPRMDAFDIKKELTTLRRGVSNDFPLTFDPDPFPQIVLDRQLVRFIYRHAISNAIRHGKAEGSVQTDVRFDPQANQFLIKIINEPGPTHESLSRLDKDQIEALFTEGTKLPVPAVEVKRENTRPSSSGGAWVMRKCAEALGGTCSLQFDQNQTCFSFSCPANPTDAPKSSSASSFELPHDTWVVVLEDSQIQRKLLDRCFARAGVPVARRVILGENAAEIREFRHLVTSIMAKNQKGKFLLIVDENLDIISAGGARAETVSGSKSVLELRNGLPKDLEARILALVRSANDSAAELDLYAKRAHGFLRKEPVRQGRLLSSIEPYWKDRFPSETEDGDETVSSFASPGVDESILAPSPNEIQEGLRQISSLVDGDNESSRWPAIRDKLHVLKGDLMTVSVGDKATGVLAEIEELVGCGDNMPTNFDWKATRARVEALF